MTGAVNRRKSSWWLPLAVLLLLSLLLLWTEGSEQGQQREPRGAARDGSVQSGFPRDVPLPGGETLHLERAPQAVVAAASGSVDLVCALIPPERVAGIPGSSERYSGLRDADSPYLARPRFQQYEAERLLQLRPDLVLAYPWQSADTTARLREAGVVVVLLPDPTDWPSLQVQVRSLGLLLGAEQAASDLLERCTEQVERLEQAATGRPEWTAVAYSNGGAGGYAAGSGTTNDEILRLAGFRNIAPRAGHTALTFEELLVLDPDALLVGGQAEAQHAGGTAGLLRTEPALASLRAVVEDRIIVLDSWLYTTLSHHLLDAAERVLEQSAEWGRAERGPR